MKNWLDTYKYPVLLLSLFLLLSIFMPLFMGTFLIGIGAFTSRILFDQGRTQFQGRKLFLFGAALLVTATTIWAAIWFFPSLHTDWETDGPYDGLILALIGVALLASLLLLPFSGYVGDRFYRTRGLRK